MAARLFGTDGIRGRAGEPPLDAPSLRAIGRIVAERAGGGMLLIGRDTRESGPAIVAALAGGAAACMEVRSAGVLPTPGLSFLARRHRFACAAMVSASHNPWADNGVKLFNRRGEKVGDTQERQIERHFAAAGPAAGGGAGREIPAVPADPYLEFLASEGGGIDGIGQALVVDAANGAAARFAPALFSGFGFRVTARHCAPTGRNINRDCGSTSPQSMQADVRRYGAAIGLALDGDADRVVFSDGRGRLLDGDHVLYALALYLKATEPRFRPLVAGTVMTNLGLQNALATHGITLLRAPVGDRHVSGLLRRHAGLLGGEPSGHTILRHRQPSGDGMLTAVYLLRALRHLGWDAAALHDRLTLFPQRLLTIPVRERRDLRRWQQLQREVQRFERAHGRDSRLLIRYSGTEPALRLMIESRRQEVIDRALPAFADLIRSSIGDPHEAKRQH